MPTSQTASGQITEYGLANAICQAFNATIEPGNIATSAQKLYEQSDHSKLDPVCQQIVLKLADRDPRLKTAAKITLPPTSKGKDGDVRDLIAKNYAGESVGISVKFGNDYLKHGRVGHTGNWAQQWTGFPLTEKWGENTNPIWKVLLEGKKAGILFSELPDKETGIYLPLRAAFEEELRAQEAKNGHLFVESYFAFQTGSGKDHHRVSISKNYKEASIYTFNANGTIKAVPRLYLPNRIETIEQDRTQYLLITFYVDPRNKWTIEHRLHSADKKVKPSIKIETRITTFPQSAQPEKVRLTIPNQKKPKNAPPTGSRQQQPEKKTPDGRLL